jgi:hypothetical protein
MAFSRWFVPNPSLAAQANLQHAINAVRNEGPTDVSKLIDLTESLLRQNMLYRTLVSQALAHVIELETKDALRPQ